MLRRTPALSVIRICAIGTLFLAACETQITPVGRTPARIELTPTDLHLKDANGEDLRAVAFDQDGKPFARPPRGFTFVWWSSNVAVAAVADSGHVTAVEPGSAEIWVALVDASLISSVSPTSTSISELIGDDAPRANASVEVVPNPTDLVYISGNDQRAASGTSLPEDLAVRVVDGEGDGVPNTTVDFIVTTGGGAVSDDAVATDSAGYARTSWTLGPASGVQTVEARADLPGDSTVTFRAEAEAPPPAAARVVIEPDSFHIAAIGDTRQLAATVFDDSGSPMGEADIAWSSLDSAVASVDGQGRVVARANGTAEILASAGDAADTASVLVAQVVAAVSVEPRSPDLTVGDSVFLSAVAVDSNAVVIDGADFLWSSSDPGIVSVTAAGIVIAHASGTANVSASYNGQTAVAAVTVSAQPPTVSDVVVLPETHTLTAIGDSVALSATAFAPDGSVVESAEIGWESLNENVATVNKMGTVISNGVGVAAIVASAVCCNAVDTVRVEVEQQVANVSVSPSAATLQVGDSIDMSVFVSDANNHEILGADVHWSSSNEAVAIVDSTGQVLGVAEGMATIRGLVGTVSDSASVTITTPDDSADPPATPSDLAVQVVEERSTEVTYRLDWSEVPTADDYEYWAGSNSGRWESGHQTTTNSQAVFTAPRSSVDDDSFACTRARNEAGVSENSCTSFTVPAQGGDPTIAAVSISPSSATIQIGASTELTATVTDVNGNVVEGVDVRWASSDETIATVDGTGTVSAVAVGTATITGSVGGISGSAEITVRDNTSTGLRAVEIPTEADWSERMVALSPGQPGAWDSRLAGAAPTAVVKKDGTYYLYYIGADADRSFDGGPRYRALGVATSSDGIHFTKHPSNPILTWLPNSGQEEGIWSATVEIADDGTFVVYYSALTGTSGSVNANIRYATSPDGINFTDHGLVIDGGEDNLPGDDEIAPVGSFEDNGIWNVYYLAKGGDVTQWSVYRAIGTDRDSFISAEGVLTGGGYRFGGGMIKVSETDWLGAWSTDRSTIEMRRVSGSNPSSSTVEAVYGFNASTCTVWLDRTNDTWYLYYNEYGDDTPAVYLRTAPATYVQ